MVFKLLLVEDDAAIREIIADYFEIWLPFKKVDPARSKTKKGTGLGLAIARTIFELHGFSYGVKNSDDGPVFWFKEG